MQRFHRAVIAVLKLGPKSVGVLVDAIDHKALSGKMK